MWDMYVSGYMGTCMAGHAGVQCVTGRSVCTCVLVWLGMQEYSVGQIGQWVHGYLNGWIYIRTLSIN